MQEQRRAQRLARYEQLIALHQEGMQQQWIAKRLQFARAVVGRYLKATGFPERALYPRLESKLDPYNPAKLIKRSGYGRASFALFRLSALAT